jgi:hypothetical protein
MFREGSDPDGCYVAFKAEQGMFEVASTWMSNGKRDVDICTIVAKHAADLEPHLPR